MKKSLSIFSQKVLYAFLLILGTLLLYSPTLSFSFIDYDDNYYVYLNPYIQNGIDFAFLKWAFTTLHFANWHPLTWISYAIDFQLFGLWAGGYHLTNIILHTANALFVFILFSRITGSSAKSFVIAAIFAWHPVKVESVAWIAERKDLLSTFFILLSLLTYAIYVKKNALLGKIFIFTLCLLLFSMSLLCKLMYVTLPVILLILDFWPLQRKTSFIKRLLEKIPFCILAGIGCFLAIRSQSAGDTINTDINLVIHMADVIRNYWSYIWLFIWPEKLSILFLYTPTTHIPFFLGLGFLFVAFTLWLHLKRNMLPSLWTGWFLFWTGLLPVVGIVKIGMEQIACRYLYWPSVGLSIFALWGLQIFKDRWWKASKEFIRCAIAALLIGLMIASGLYLRFWENTHLLFSYALFTDPNNWRAHLTLQSSLTRSGLYKEAAKHRLRLIELNPSFSLPEKELLVDWRVFYYMAKAAWKKNAPELALSCLLKAQHKLISVDPQKTSPNHTSIESCIASIESGSPQCDLPDL